MTEQEAIEFCKNNPEAATKIIMMVEYNVPTKLEDYNRKSLNRPNINWSI